MSDNHIIFRLDRDDYDYKGVLFADLDVGSSAEEMGMPPPPKGYQAGVMGIIWTDEKGQWHGKMRIKFPSGNKQVITCNFEDEFKNGVKVNETYVLNRFYKMPMINKVWRKNEDGTPQGIVKLIQELDMIESMRVMTIEQK